MQERVLGKYYKKVLERNATLLILIFTGKIVSTPSCQCGSFESPYRFFQCPRYAATRNMFLPHDINRCNTHDFLFGIESKTICVNEALCIKVQDFIVKGSSQSAVGGVR